MGTLLERLVPEPLHGADAETRRRAELLVRCIGLFVLVYPVMTLVYAVRCHPLAGLWIACAGTLHPVALLVLRRTRNVTWAGHVCCLALWLTFVSLAAVTGGTNAPVFADQVLLVVLATMFCGERGGKIWVGIVVAGVLVNAVLTHHGIAIRNLLPAAVLVEFRTAELFAFGGVLTAMTFIYERVKNGALASLEEARAVAAAAHEEAELLLDLTGQGFVSLELDGRVAGDVSTTAKRWLPELVCGARFAEVVGGHDPPLGESFELYWEQVAEGALPFEVAIDQMPTRMHLDDRVCAIAYRPIVDGEHLVRVVIIMTDITAQLGREAAEAEKRDLLGIIDHVVADPAAVAEFLDDARGMVDALAGGPRELHEEFRMVHTLKGNSGLFGLHSFASTCHALEFVFADEQRALDRGERDVLARAWSNVEQRVRPMLGGARSNDVVIAEPVYRAFLASVEAGTAHAELAGDVRLWSLDSVENRLVRLGAQARALHERVGRGELELRIDAGGVHSRTDDLTAFWRELVHVFRNAIDHGFENDEVRCHLGKPERHLLEVSARDDGDLVIEVRDDGGGVDWFRVYQRAQRLGLPVRTTADLHAAIFADGVSSRTDATMLSGRGVGLAALKEACDALGARIEVDSSPAGTAFRFRIPRSAEQFGALRCAA